eukprot:Selendium_serpulae@DN5214_c0_g1_i10.p2
MATEEDKEGAVIPEELRPAKWDLRQDFETNIQNALAATAVPDEEVMEPLTFHDKCASCGAPTPTRMCEIDIPGFRRCIIMAMNCGTCGARSNEVKPGGAIGDKGRKWTLTVRTDGDLNRDVLKSDTARCEVPSLGFTMQSGTQGGVFTTVEGLLVNTADHLSSNRPFASGDSAAAETKAAFDRTVDALRKMASDPALRPFDIVISDPADQSFVGPTRFRGLVERDIDTAAKGDANLVVQSFVRSDEEDDELGLKDMKVD